MPLKYCQTQVIIPLTQLKRRFTTLSAGIVPTAHLVSPIPMIMIIRIILLLLMPKRFISRARRPRRPSILQRNLKPRSSFIPTMRLSNLLVPIRTLCIPEPTPRRSILILDAIRPARTATRAQRPEEARGKGESHGEPGCDVHAVAERAVDVIFSEGAVEGADEGGVEDCACEGEGDDEEGGDGGDDRGGYTA